MHLCDSHVPLDLPPLSGLSSWPLQILSLSQGPVQMLLPEALLGSFLFIFLKLAIIHSHGFLSTWSCCPPWEPKLFFTIFSGLCTPECLAQSLPTVSTHMLNGWIHEINLEIIDCICCFKWVVLIHGVRPTEALQSMFKYVVVICC